MILCLEILIFKVSESMYVAKITAHFEGFDSHVAKITSKLLAGLSREITLACFNFVIISLIFFSLAIISLRTIFMPKLTCNKETIFVLKYLLCVVLCG